MTPRTFYRIALLLPIVLPLAGLPFIDDNSLFAMLLASLVFGGAAYLPLAIFIFFWLKRYETARQIIRFSLFIPLLYMPLQILTLFLLYLIEQTQTGFSAAWKLVPIFAIYSLAFGYSYVLLSYLLYRLFKTLNWIRPGLQN